MHFQLSLSRKWNIVKYFKIFIIYKVKIVLTSILNYYFEYTLFLEETWNLISLTVTYKLHEIG